jgi:rod shape-determining protein MreD
MAKSRRNHGWVIWLTFAIGLLLSVSPMPQFLEVFRPMWLALLVSFWTLMVPNKVGMTTAFVLGLAEDVLYGTLLGQNALILTLITFLVLSLQQRFGIAQLIQLWLSALTGNRLPTLALVWSAVISALLWPWISFALRDLRRRLHIN